MRAPLQPLLSFLKLLNSSCTHYFKPKTPACPQKASKTCRSLNLDWIWLYFYFNSSRMCNLIYMSILSLPFGCFCFGVFKILSTYIECYAKSLHCRPGLSAELSAFLLFLLLVQLNLWSSNHTKASAFIVGLGKNMNAVSRMNLHWFHDGRHHQEKHEHIVVIAAERFPFSAPHRKVITLALDIN